MQANCIGNIKNYIYQWMWEESYGSYHGAAKLGLGCNLMKIGGTIFLVLSGIYCAVTVAWSIYETLNSHNAIPELSDEQVGKDK